MLIAAHQTMLLTFSLGVFTSGRLKIKIWSHIQAIWVNSTHLCKFIRSLQPVLPDIHQLYCSMVVEDTKINLYPWTNSEKFVFLKKKILYNKKPKRACLPLYYCVIFKMHPPGGRRHFFTKQQPLGVRREVHAEVSKLPHALGTGSKIANFTT